MYFIVLLLLVEPAAQPCLLDCSSYSRRAQRKSTAEAKLFGKTAERSVCLLFYAPQFHSLKARKKSSGGFLVRCGLDQNNPARHQSTSEEKEHEQS
jgi:hypothetical protein